MNYLILAQSMKMPGTFCCEEKLWMNGAIKEGKSFYNALHSECRCSGWVISDKRYEGTWKESHKWR